MASPPTASEGSNNSSKEEHAALRKVPTAAASLDAFLLDDFLLRLLLPKFNALLDGEREFSLPFLRIASLWCTQGQTPALQVLGLQFAPRKKESTEDSTVWRARLLSYIAASVVLPALYERLKAWIEILEQRLQQQEQTCARPQLAMQRQRAVLKVARRLMDRLLPPRSTWLSPCLLDWDILYSQSFHDFDRVEVSRRRSDNNNNSAQAPRRFCVPQMVTTTGYCGSTSRLGRLFRHGDCLGAVTPRMDAATTTTESLVATTA